MRRFAGLILGAVLTSSLAACASGEADRGPAPGGPGGRDLHYPNIFVSPMGQPFRARFDAPYPVATWFAQADANHDGRLTREEFRADAEAFFHTLDTNHDGVIDGAEVENYEQNIAPEILPQIGRLHGGEGMDSRLDLGDPHNTDRPKADTRGRGLGQAKTRVQKGEPDQGAALFSMLNQPEPVSAADTDFNGRISLAEFLAAADRRFDHIDKAQQGYLTLATLPKTPVQLAIEKAAARLARDKAKGRLD
ncbi:MAG: EF-hand domain-containing protein [Caulobacteraceae bacterium]